MHTDSLIQLEDRYRRHVGGSGATLSNKITGTHARLFKRLRNGGGCSVRTFNLAMAWFDANWPDDLEWPRSIPRPSEQRRSS